MKTDRAGFCPKNPDFRILGLTVPKWPEIAKIDPKMTQIDVFLENGSNDFTNFWPEVRGPKLKKTDRARFGRKNPVFQDSGLTVPKWVEN